MRKGINKSKVEPLIEITTYHRVIVPVYIPNLTEDYYKDGLKILEYCLESLFRTIHKKTRVSIINNGCCDEVVRVLEHFKSKYDTFDQLYDSETNLGKINAVYSVIRANTEPLLTISDADVLFLEGWQENVEEVFKNFPKAGIVSPVPSSIAYENPNASTTLGHAIFNSKFEFSNVIDSSGLIKFQESISRLMYRQAHLEQWPVIRNKANQKAVLGCGHFCATLKRIALEEAPKQPSVFKLGMGAVAEYLDKPINKAGYLRLATEKNLAFHLGNVAENWMVEMMPNQGYNALTVDQESMNLLGQGVPRLTIFFGVVISKILNKWPAIKIWYFKKKGLKYDYY